MPIRIAVDAMGGDFAPVEIVKGSVQAAREYGVAIQLVGDEVQIKEELAKYDITGLDIAITHTDEVIEMGEAPAKALRAKKKASIILTVDSVARGESQGLVAAGSTGAAMAASLFGLGRLPGIKRPVICCTMPTVKQPIAMLDGGANTDCEPEMLYEFAIMGKIFAELILGYKNPKVGLMNIGEEEGKGNELAKNTFNLLNEKKELFNFIGNVEGRDIFTGDCHVIVCDGFVGNVALKTGEGALKMMGKLIKEEIYSSFLNKILGFFSKRIFAGIKKRLDYEKIGGALLLGVKGVSVIAHGSSKAYSVKNAIRVAKEAVEKNINEKIVEMYNESLKNAQ